MRRFWFWPVALGVGVMAVWAIADPDGFAPWEGLALLALAPLLFWFVYRLAKSN